MHPAARLVSPLLRRILLVNALPLALLVAALLYLDQYQNGLLEAEVRRLREQARIYAGALGESAVRERDAGQPAAGARAGPPAAAPADRADAERAGQALRARRPAHRRQPGARGRRRRGQSPSRCRRRSTAAPCWARSARSTTECSRCCRTRRGTGGRRRRARHARRARLAARREGGAAADQRQQQPRDAALHPPHPATTGCWSRSPSRCSATARPSASSC